MNKTIRFNLEETSISHDIASIPIRIEDAVNGGAAESTGPFNSDHFMCFQPNQSVKDPANSFSPRTAFTTSYQMRKSTARGRKNAYY